ERELRTLDHSRRSPDPYPTALRRRQDRLSRGERIGYRLFAPNVFARFDGLTIQMLVFLHVGEIHEQIERLPSEHLVDVGIVVGNFELLSAATSPLRNDVACANQLHIRALPQLRKVNSGDTTAANDTHLDSPGLFCWPLCYEGGSCQRR